MAARQQDAAAGFYTAAGREDSNDTDFLGIDLAPGVFLDKVPGLAAGQQMVMADLIANKGALISYPGSGDFFMKTTIIALFTLLAMSSAANAQPEYQWHTFYGAGATDRAYATAYDTWGNTYTAGMTEGAWNGPGGQAPIHAHSGPTNVFVLKLDASGNYVWHTFFGGANDCYGFDITLDSNNNPCVTGFADSTWNGPAGQAPLHAYSGGDRDVFVLKLNANGAYQWHTFYGSGDGGGLKNEGSGIACDSLSNVYASGFSPGTWTGPAGQAPLNAYSGGRDIFILKLNSAGAYQWHTFYGSAGEDDEIHKMDTDSSNNILVGGYSKATWNGPGARPPIHAHTGTKDIAIIKLTGNGAYQWHTFYGGGGSDEVQGITTGAGNVYACGNSSAAWQGDGASDPIHPYSGGADHVVLKLAANGAYGWHTFYGSAGEADYANNLNLDSSNNLYIAGRSYATWTGDGNVGPLHAFSGYRDISIFKLTATGAYQWHTFYGDVGDDRGQDVVLDGSALYVSGRCSKTWNGDTVTDTPLNPFSGGAGDAFVLKLELPGTNIVPAVSDWGKFLFAMIVAWIGFYAIKRKKFLKI